MTSNGGTTKVRVAVDAMGGDFAPYEPIAGALEALNSENIEITLVGDKDQLVQELSGKLPAASGTFRKLSGSRREAAGQVLLAAWVHLPVAGV